MFFLAASLLKLKKLQPPPGKLVVRPDVDGSDLCVADSGWLATARSPNPTAHFPNTTASIRLWQSFPHSEDLLLTCCVLVEGEKAERFSGRRQIFKVLHHCNVKGVLSHLTWDKVLKVFPFEPCVVSTQEAVVVTHQVELSTLV